MYWLPWKYLIRRFAQANKFIDSLLVLARLQKFAQPSEVQQPIELLRAGLVFHARGLINTKAIQHNLDWIWPYWVQRQFNPLDPSFIPRAFSISHVNLSHRNWTAIGLPFNPYLPIIDPSGLITPFYDGWSLDAWLLTEDGTYLLPSKMKNGEQAVFCSNDSYPIVTEHRKGADWIIRKRKGSTKSANTKVMNQDLLKGLLPAGFSAEHLGLNDYYWDDFWGVAGLEATAELMRASKYWREAQHYQKAAMDFRVDIEKSITASKNYYSNEIAIAASQLRRLDSGAIGSLAASYPLKLWMPKDSRLMATTQYLLDQCLVKGGFFQDMIHSGINAYLTLHLTQTLLRDGNMRYLELIQAVADLASPTGQWPEAIHPHTSGGCMGDGQHAWAAAEWVLMIFHLFIREEGEQLLLLPGIPSAWLQGDVDLQFGPALTVFGSLHLSFTVRNSKRVLQWKAIWSQAPVRIAVHFCGEEPIACPLSENGRLEF